MSNTVGQMTVKDNPDGTKTVGDGVHFERIRRITGYLVGDMRSRFNDAKKAEERDRVKHSLYKGDAPCSEC